MGLWELEVLSGRGGSSAACRLLALVSPTAFFSRRSSRFGEPFGKTRVDQLGRGKGHGERMRPARGGSPTRGEHWPRRNMGTDGQLGLLDGARQALDYVIQARRCHRARKRSAEGDRSTASSVPRCFFLVFAIHNFAAYRIGRGMAAEDHLRLERSPRPRRCGVGGGRPRDPSMKLF